MNAMKRKRAKIGSGVNVQIGIKAGLRAVEAGLGAAECATRHTVQFAVSVPSR